jgi:hypothetical protein
VPPAVNVGPDTTSTWGVPVQFNGQATPRVRPTRRPCSTAGTR